MQVRFFSFVFIALLCMRLNAQQDKAIMSMAEKEFNFGTIKETEGLISHNFQFSNDGKVPLIINDVKSSCGCTVPEWPREPVLPGKSGIVKVSFDPKKQSGSIRKTIQISSNAETPLTIIAVKGVVVPADLVDEVYKFKIGDLRLQSIYAAFGELYKGKNGKVSIKVFNGSDSIPASLMFRKVPSHIKVKLIPEVIAPQNEGIIELEYLTSAINSWDYTVDRLDLLVNNKVYPNNRINVTANIKEDFSALSAEQLASSARIEFDSKQFDFGNISDGKTVEHSFKLTNTGKSELYIRKVSASCGCTAVQPAKTTILPGESTIIKAVFNPKGREGNQKKAITVITNDPKESKSVLWINAMVQKPVTGNQ